MTDSTDFDLLTFFPYSVRVFYLAVSETVKDVYHSRYGLAQDEWRAMTVLHTFEPLSATGIVTRSSLGKVNVSRAITSLQKRGFLERHIDPGDRRRALLRLTKKGKDVMRELVPIILEMEKEILSPLSQDEVKTMVGWMEKVRTKTEQLQMASKKNKKKEN